MGHTAWLSISRTLSLSLSLSLWWQQTNLKIQNYWCCCSIKVVPLYSLSQRHFHSGEKIHTYYDDCPWPDDVCLSLYAEAPGSYSSGLFLMMNTISMNSHWSLTFLFLFFLLMLLNKPHLMLQHGRFHSVDVADSGRHGNRGTGSCRREWIGVRVLELQRGR